MADQDDDLENDVDSTDASGDLDVASNEAMPPAMTSSMKMPGSPPPMNPVVQQYLQNKQAMVDAQKQASNNEMYTGLGRAAATLAAGMAHSNQPVDQTPFNAMAATDQQPVTDIQNAQKSQAADLSNQSALVDTQKKIGDSDPNSPQSQQFRATLKANFPRIADAYGDQFDQLTAEDSANVFKVVETKEKIDARKDELQSRAADRQESAATRADAKSTAEQNKALNYVTSQLDSARGDGAVKQAQVDLYSTKKINSLINMYGDPNQLSESQVKLLAQEVAKVATGGIPGEAGTEGITPNTLRGRMSQFLTNLTNNPSPANAAAFVKQYKDYSGTIAKDAQSTIKSKLDAVIETHRNQMGEDNYQTVKKQYYNRYGIGDDSDSSTSSDTTQDHASRAAQILAKRQAAAGAQNPTPTPPPAPPTKPEAAQTPPPPASSGSQYLDGYAYGGIVTPPTFHPVHESMQPRMQAPKPVALPKAPTAQIPLGMRAPERAIRFDHGGQVPGQPQFQHNDPRNDVVNAKLTPKEIVLPLSITQSKDVPMAAYLYIKHLLAAQGK